MFNLNSTIEILERTPQTIHSLLYNVNEQWANTNEGGESWSPFDVVGHLIHCDEENWIPRIKIVLSESEVRSFDPLNRFAQFEKNKGKTINQLLDDFVRIRFTSITTLRQLNLTKEQFGKTATHPDLGSVSLSQLISTWMAHDMDHLAQISRVIAKQYVNEVGPWISYLRILKQ
ncbi:MAG: DinB family protein [Bacteroidetes bacterium]|jgi:hypothetical protein|nr:DinB family protein [Bacteroidota bacterium]